ncbi:MAG: SDR family NAD(P)-dependent oxidoreductase, partial [Candidatus Aenigmarchaeota archaeon]|nr:SDR family NAD(P)-dependent oxidoreductase [Candidatus Aenigmarchaeota archaeon]
MEKYKDKRIFITGGAGFIGCNLTKYFLDRGAFVIVFDNLSRKGTETNLRWLQIQKSQKFKFSKGDIRDFTSLTQIFKETEPEVVLHCCAQTAV